MICVAATYVFPRERIDEAKAVLPQLVESTRREPGCLMYVAHQKPGDPSTFFFYEQYRDEAALEAHRASPHFARFVIDTLREIAVRRDLNVYAPLS